MIFRPGDKVKCIDNSDDSTGYIPVSLNEVYVIESIVDKNYVTLVGGDYRQWRANRFIPVPHDPAESAMLKALREALQ